LAILKIILLAFFLISKSYAGFSCETLDGKSSLFYQKSKLESWEIVDLTFDQYAFIPAYLNCASFLDQIKNNYSIHSKTSSVSFQQLITFNGIKSVRILGELRHELYKECAKSIGCNLKFPLSLMTQEKDGQTLNDLFKNKYPQCLEKEKLLTRKKEVISSKELFKVIDVFDISERKIINEFYKLLDSDKWSRIYISTMTFSPEFLADIIKKTAITQTKVHLLFSFGFQSLIGDFPSYLYDLPPNIILHPIFLSPHARTSYHIKGALFIGDEPKYLFFTGNFRKYDEEDFSDMAMVASVKDPQSIEQFFLSQISYNCHDKIYSDCSIRPRFENNSSSVDLVSNLLNKSCLNERSTPNSKTIAYSPREINISSLVHNFIMGAKKSIKIHTHQFNDPNLVALLENKTKEGIIIRVIQGRSGPIIKSTPSFILQNTLTKEYHSKYIILDDSRILWTTGNFTKTSYTNPWEMTFILDDPFLVKTFIENFIHNELEIGRKRTTPTPR
jgi:hypothetical protein